MASATDAGVVVPIRPAQDGDDLDEGYWASLMAQDGRGLQRQDRSQDGDDLDEAHADGRGVSVFDRIEIDQAKRKLRTAEAARAELQAEKATEAREAWEESATANPLLDSRGYVDWEAAFEAAPEEPDWLVKGFLEKGMAHSLFGIPGHGKSLVALETIVRRVIGSHHVLYVDSENHLLNVIVPRLKSFGVTPKDLERLHMLSFAQIEPLDTLAGGTQLVAHATETGAALVVIDTTSRFIEGEENAADTFLKFYNHTLMKLKARDIASLRLDHPGKDTTRGTRGSSAKYGDIDYEFFIEDPDDGRTLFRRLECTKSRTVNLAKGSAVMLRKHGVTEQNPYFWHEWTSEDADDPAGELAERLDHLGVPSDAGRPAVRKALKGANISKSNTEVEAAIRLRKSRPPGTCITPECGKPGQLYAGGWLCDDHQPGKADRGTGFDVT